MILFLRFPLSFSFNCEDISNIQDSVWPHLQTPRSSSKILRYVSYFQLFSWCLEMWSNTAFRVWYITYYCYPVFLPLAKVFPLVVLRPLRNGPEKKGVLVKTLSKKLKLDDGQISLGVLSRPLFLQKKLQRTLYLLGLGGSFIVPDENGLSKCFINQCITMQCIIRRNREIARESTELVSY